MPVARRGTNYMPSTIGLGIAGHHRFVLSLRHLVFAEVKPFGEGDIMLILTIGLPARLRRRTTHGKSAWRTPNHIHRHGGIQIHGAVAHHRDGAGSGGRIACSVLHGVG